MKKIFILTGEPSGDKLASTVISKLKSQNPNIEYSSVGGNHLKKLGIESIFNLNGKVVLRKNIKNQIDISDLNKGIYFTELMNESNKSFQKLIVKK